MQAALDWLQTGANGPLVLVLLLLGWLWMLVRRRPGDEPMERRIRPAPLNDDELGRLAFRAALSGDAQLWRDLFVNGAEARELLGPQAVTFLEERPPEMLEEVLQQLRLRVPVGSTYGGIEVGPSGVRAMRIKLPDGGEDVASLGHIAEVGATVRLWGGRP